MAGVEFSGVYDLGSRGRYYFRDILLLDSYENTDVLNPNPTALLDRVTESFSESEKLK